MTILGNPGPWDPDVSTVESQGASRPPTNPLVAPRPDTRASPCSGVWIAEDIEQLRRGIANRSWVDTTLGSVGAGLDALGIIADPLGVLLRYGVAWLIEHVRPLTEALNQLAGDPPQITAHAQTWRNVAGALRDSAARLGEDVQAEVADWRGDAADAYRRWSGEQQGALGAMALGSDAMALATELAGMLVAGVRLTVRDQIAALAAKLVKIAFAEIASAGTATALAVQEVASLVTTTANSVARVLRALVASLDKLQLMVSRLRDLIAELRRILDRLRSGAQPPRSLPPGPDRPLLKPAPPSSAVLNPDGVPGGGPGTKRLGTLDESRVSRDADGLITAVDGRPVNDYLVDLSRERAQNYVALKAKRTMSGAEIGPCIAVGLDRRTGKVYEGINGLATDVIPEDALQGTLRGNYDAMVARGPYYYPDQPDEKSTPHEFPHPDVPLRHAEIKATDLALKDRMAAGVPAGREALGELVMAPSFPFTKGGPRPAPFCAACNQVLDGVESATGRYNVWSPSKGSKR